VVGGAVRSNPDLIVATGDRIAREVKSATSSIPVVAIVSDPVANGIVASLARPGGNITGVSIDAGVEIEGKRLEFLRDIFPSASRVGYLASQRLWEASAARALREAAQRVKIAVLGPAVDPPFNEQEYRRVFGTMAQEGLDAIFVNAQPENVTNAQLVVTLAAENKLPAFYPYSDFVEIGGLIAYGVDHNDPYRHMADAVHQIFQGAKPGDIPFYQPTKFALTVNLKTAKALGITVPPTLLIAADQVIE
jgi:putative ABC transport system substrate-binding protein